MELICARFVCPVVEICDDDRRNCTSRAACDAAEQCLGRVEDLGRVPPVLARVRELWASRAEGLDVPELLLQRGPDGVSPLLRPLTERPQDPDFEALLSSSFVATLLARELHEDVASGEPIFLDAGAAGVEAVSTRVHGVWFSPWVPLFSAGDAMRSAFMPTTRIVSRFELSVRTSLARDWQRSDGRFDRQRLLDWQRRTGCALPHYVQAELLPSSLPGTRAPLLITNGFDDDGRFGPSNS